MTSGPLDEMRRKGEVKMKCLPRAMRGRRPMVGMRVRKGRSLSQSAVGADWQTAGDPPGIGLPGEVPPIYPLGSDLWDVWGR